MAKKNVKNEKSNEESLWQSCNSLRGTVDTSDYKHVVFRAYFLEVCKRYIRRAQGRAPCRWEREVYRNERLLYYGERVFPR